MALFKASSSPFHRFTPLRVIQWLLRVVRTHCTLNLSIPLKLYPPSLVVNNYCILQGSWHYIHHLHIKETALVPKLIFGGLHTWCSSVLIYTHPPVHIVVCQLGMTLPSYKNYPWSRTVVIFFKSIVWSIVSKNFWRSIKIPTEYILLSILSVISSIRSSCARAVNLLFLNPYWPSLSKLCVLIKSFNRATNSFSRIFDNCGRIEIGR